MSSGLLLFKKEKGWGGQRSVLESCRYSMSELIF